MEEDPLDALSRKVKALVDLGRRRGYVTYDEVYDSLPPEKAPPEIIEDTMAMLNNLDIHVVPSPPQD